jgi:hypothetical protein
MLSRTKFCHSTARTIRSGSWFALVLAFVLLSVSSGCSRDTQLADGETIPLKSGTDPVWWDAEKQEVNVAPTNVLPNADNFLAERSELKNDPLQKKTKTSSNWNWNWGWLSIFSLSNIVLILGIILLLVMIGILVFVVIKPDLSFRKNTTKTTQRRVSESQKITELPFDVPITDTGLMATANRYAAEGNYDSATIYLYSYLLVELDHHQRIRLRRGKTNRMYLRELHGEGYLSSRFHTVMLTFERSFFGKHEITRDEFTLCQRASDDINSKLNDASDTSNVRTNDVKLKPVAIGLLLASCIAIGCGQKLPLEEYGESSSSGSASLSGFTAMRALFEASGRRTMDTNLLSQRLDGYGSIVWTPDRYSPPTAAECTWIDTWLERNDGSTFIYVGRDYDAGPDYWRECSRRAANGRQQPYLNEAGHSQSDSDLRYYSQVDESISYSRWFSFKPKRGDHSIDKTAVEFDDAAERSIEMQTRGVLIPTDAVMFEDDQPDVKSMLLENIESDIETAADLRFKKWKEDMEDFGWSDDVDYFPNEVDLESDELTYEDLVEARYLEKIDKEESSTDNPMIAPLPPPKDEVEEDRMIEIAMLYYSDNEVTVVAENEDGVPLIYRVWNPRWNSSQMFVVNNSSLCCNYALADKDRRMVTAQLIDQTKPKSRVAFVKSSNPRLQYYRIPSNQPFGFALFRIYPLNIIFTHALFLGFVALVALWPIFGRAKENVVQGASDFGKHVESLGYLLKRTRDRNFAIKAIARYFREVRHENNSHWATIDQEVEAALPPRPTSPPPPPPPVIPADPYQQSETKPT